MVFAWRLDALQRGTHSELIPEEYSPSDDFVYITFVTILSIFIALDIILFSYHFHSFISQQLYMTNQGKFHYFCFNWKGNKDQSS